MRNWLLGDLNYGVLKQQAYEVVVLPMGATEPHNLHLPYATDTIEGEAIAGKACELAFGRGARVAMLPPIPYGTETNQREFPLSMNLQPSTLAVVIRDLVQSVERAGIRKFVLLNSHGGNDFKPLLRELYGQTQVHLFLCDWFRGLSADVQRELFVESGDHAGEMETALIMALRPDLVARDEQTGRYRADDGATASTELSAVNKGWVTLTRPWHLLTTNSGAGNPHPATAEQGRKFLDIVTNRLADFLVELAETPVTETFPYAGRPGDSDKSLAGDG